MYTQVVGISRLFCGLCAQDVGKRGNFYVGYVHRVWGNVDLFVWCVCTSGGEKWRYLFGVCEQGVWKSKDIYMAVFTGCGKGRDIYAVMWCVCIGYG